jgi:hypothetical protein
MGNKKTLLAEQRERNFAAAERQSERQMKLLAWLSFFPAFTSPGLGL